MTEAEMLNSLKTPKPDSKVWWTQVSLPIPASSSTHLTNSSTSVPTTPPDLAPTLYQLSICPALMTLTSDRRLLKKSHVFRVNWVFFQITNHGIEEDLLESVVGAIKGFHEQPADIKERVYSRDMKRSISFFSNVDLFHSKTASWRDTLQIKLGPTFPELDEIPEIYRQQVMEWNEKVRKLGELLMEVLCEGLGVDKGKLKELTFTEGRTIVGHNYPYCPQPHLTMGIASHIDAGVLTILLQDLTDYV